MLRIKGKMLSLIPKRQENLKEIKVPDLKQYLVNGYEEIRQVKQKNIELTERLEEENKNKQLYEGTLVTLAEFKQRDDENKCEIKRLENKVRKKEEEIKDINSELNTYKIRQIEYNKREENLKNEIDNRVKTEIDKLKEDINNYNKELLKDSTMSIKNTDLTARILQSQKILNMIEGEKK